MSAIRLTAADRVLIGLAVFADLASVLSFLGLEANAQIRWILVAALALVGIVSSLVTLFTSIKLWASPKGSLYPAGFHARRIVVGVVVLGISVALAAVLVPRAATLDAPPESPDPGPSVGAASTRFVQVLQLRIT